MNQINLQMPVRYLKGIGPERSKIFSRVGLETIEDLFYFFPRRYEDRFPVKRISELTLGEKECVGGVVSARGFVRTRHGPSIFKVVISDGKNALFASWFNQPYLSKVFQPKTRVIFYGKAERAGKHLQMVHPEYELVTGADTGTRIHMGRIVPIYPLTEELNQKSVRRLLFQTIKDFGRFLKEPFSPEFRRRMGLPDIHFAFGQIHFPNDPAARESAYRRLVFDEFFALQLLIQIKKAELQKEDGALRHLTGEKEVERFLDSLDFSPGPGQRKAIEDILNDMKKARPMNRMVQGEVGSGKTVVAAAGLVFTAANDFQGALMAPTEVLAQQHYFNLSRMLEPLGITCGYLAQGLSAVEKENTLTKIAAGEIQVLVGTHALLESNVQFKKLRLVVIDEQHRFGVFQRVRLKEKGGGGAHFLLMTATPIPRTLAMTLYGDLDVSTIRELPKGRRPIRTFWVGEEKRREIYALLDSEMKSGRQGYVICPLIQEGDRPSLKNVLGVHRELAAVLSSRKVSMLHGRMKSAEKKKVMQDFKERRIEVLVSTVVIEVGIDVPNATFMVIENAERFGLAQLHQLRGRVGRGSEESFCVLFSSSEDPETTERLGAFEETQSGFEIAEKDLDLRGAGDMAGERQHGLPVLKIGNLVQDAGVLEKARVEAKRIVENDPRLNKPQNRLLKDWLGHRSGFSREKITVTA